MRILALLFWTTQLCLAGSLDLSFRNGGEGSESYSFAFSNEYNESYSYGFSQTIDSLKRNRKEKSSAIWLDHISDDYSFSPTLLFVRDNKNRKGLGADILLRIFHSSKITLSSGLGYIRFKKDIDSEVQSLQFNGDEDYKKFQGQIALAYLFLPQSEVKVSYKQYSYKDDSDIKVTLNGSFSRALSNISTYGLIQSTKSISINHKYRSINVFIGLDHSDFQNISEKEFYYFSRLSYDLSSKLSLAALIDYENLNDSFYYGLSSTLSF
ncbi:MAG: hypothetical protein BM556_00625 [Bacteriovorax sp. MedPE-SWde]|nr:MAG: hypothetical protein BM556_00625 [Bacteriovorax sp. MedPE-SWde]